MKILVVEDDPQDFAYYEASLSDVAVDYRLTPCVRVSEAEEHLRQHDFDVILCDLHLPDSNGFETFEKLKRAAPETPIVIMSGYDDRNLAAEIVKAGAQDYLVKSKVSGTTLPYSLRSAIERHHLLREMEASHRKEQYLAYHDGLTGLPNRQLFHDRLNNAARQASRYGRYMAVLFIDLDQFKPINDRFGHRWGDKLLKAVSERLSRCVRESDTVSRFGGDEFAIILSQISRKENAARTAEKIIEVLAEPFDVGFSRIVLSATIGISIFPEDSADVEKILDYADLAMYRARSKGVRYDFYNRISRMFTENTSDAERSLREAINNDELVLYYQPQVDLYTNDLIGLEALVRWRHPEKGLLPPSDFVGFAEETGLIDPLGKWVLRKGCQQIRKWRDAGYPAFRLGINISPRQFVTQRLQETVIEVIGETDADPGQLVLEITEGVAIDNVDYTIKTLNDLREMGVGISIDDFGTAYASLSYLKRLPVDSIKIDRSFVRSLVCKNEDWTILSAIIEMAHGLNLRVIAEGVEQAEKIGYLQELNCDEYQGFYLSPPVPEHEVESFLGRLPG
jgi:diguanylate cyclase (GGDEF)-like protein